MNEIKGPVSITGIRLNDARYFEQHPPHPRKKMTILRVFPKALMFPDTSDKSQDSSSIITSSRTMKHDKILINQRSEEVATFFYTDSNISIHSGELKTENREVQTEIEPQAKKMNEFSQPIEKDPTCSKRIQDTAIASTFEVSPTLEISTKLEENLGKANPGPVAIEEKRHSDTRTEDENSTKSSWWRSGYLKQIFVDFFLQLLGRKDAAKKKSRENMTEKYSVATSTKDRGQRAGRTKRNDCRKHRTKKYVNSYNSTQHRKRNKRSRGDEVIFDLIRLTQQENLRATILEQALRTRSLEEENARFRKKLDEKLKTRQRSSPLY